MQKKERVGKVAMSWLKETQNSIPQAPSKPPIKDPPRRGQPF